MLSTSSDRATVGRGVGENRGVGVGVIVSVGVMVARGGPGVFVRVAVLEDVTVSDGGGVSVGVGVWLGVADGPMVAVLGVADGPMVAVLGATAGTVGRAGRVGEGLGVERGAVGDTADTGFAVGSAPQPATTFKMVTRSNTDANHGMARPVLAGLRSGLLDRINRSLSIICPHKSC
jgi:hypothetical protein